MDDNQSILELQVDRTASKNLAEVSRWAKFLSITGFVFMPDETELHRLLDFVKAGNTVFISTHGLSYDAQNFFNCDDYAFDLSLFGVDVETDTLSVGLLSPPFPDQKKYDYPGRRYDGYFEKYNKETSYELGSKDDTDINFIRLKAGKGSIYLHLAPLTFSNYFLLHGSGKRIHGHIQPGSDYAYI